MKEKFARWDILFLQYLKRDWKKIIIWFLGLGLFSSGFVPAFKEIAKGQGLIGMYETLQNPAMIAMVGPTPVDSATDYTLGAMYTHEMLLFCGLFTMIISILHVIGHTRKEEDLGLTELVRSFQIGRQANSFATMMEVIFINVLLALFTAIVMASFGADTITVEGSFLFGASVGMAGVIGAAIALVMAQIMPTSAAATGSSLAMIGLLYIIRAVTDISNEGLSMVNPFGWFYLTYPFTENNWSFILISIVFVIILSIVAFWLEEGRDMGAGYLPQREGRAYAKQSLLSVPGLLINRNRSTMIGWFIGFFIIGVSYGSIYGDMQAFLESNDLMKQMFSESGVTMEKSFTATIMMVMICLVVILPIVVVNKLFSEEVRLHFSQIFATKVTRTQLYWTTVCIAVFSGLVGMLLASGGLASSAIATMDSNSSMGMSEFLIAGFNFFPAVLFFIGLASLALGWLPQLGKGVYIYLTYSFLLTYFDGILDLPAWVSKTSIQSWIPQMPVESFDAQVFLIISSVGIVLIVLGFIGYRNRDLKEGA